MRPAVRWGMLCSAVIAAASSGAAAAPAAQDPSAGEAQMRFEEGLARVKAGDFVAARVSFAQAYAVLHRPRILWNLALSEEKTGHFLDALAHFKQVARDPTTAEPDRANAQLHAGSLASETGHVDVQAPPGVTLTVDGGPLWVVSPLSEPLDVLPGHHVIEAKIAQGTKSVSVDAPAGQIAHISFLSSDAPAAAPAPAVAPAQGAMAAPGIALPASNPTEPSTPLGASPTDAAQQRSVPVARIVTVGVIGGAAVGAVVLGAYFGLQSQADSNTAAGFRHTYGSSACSSPMPGLAATCSRWNDVVKSENQEASVSTALYLAAGILGAGALATWFSWPRGGERKASALWVAPAVAPGLTGVGAGGSF